jgi:hypothetical protein
MNNPRLHWFQSTALNVSYTATTKNRTIESACKNAYTGFGASGDLNCESVANSKNADDGQVLLVTDVAQRATYHRNSSTIE